MRTLAAAEFPAFKHVFGAPATGLAVAWWRMVLGIALVVGWVARVVAVTAPAVFVVAGVATPVALIVNKGTDPRWAVAAVGLFLVILFGAAQWRTHRRFVVGRFVDHTAKADEADSRTVDLASLLVAELSALSDLFRVVGNRSGVAGNLGPTQVLDATLSVNEDRPLEGALASDSTMQVGPVTVPLAPLIALAGRLSRATRLTGSLHSDGACLTLTAQLQRRGGMSWQISQPVTHSDDTDAANIDRPVSHMLNELALLVFADLAIERGVPPTASAAFVEGLRRFRSCLRTPNERKINLKEAEREFLRALAEDEDLPLGYYNLGVVYSELLALALTAGQTEEASLHLRAADTAFARAIEKDPSHWQSYFALAQTRLRYRDYDVAIQLCSRVDELGAKRADRARAWELRARALRARARDGARRAGMQNPGPRTRSAPDVRLAEDDLRRALKASRKAFRLARRALLRARLIRRTHPRDLSTSEPWCAELAAACAQTYAITYCAQISRVPESPTPPPYSHLASHRIRFLRRQAFRVLHFRPRRWHRSKIVRRPRTLIGFARAVTADEADLRCQFGLYVWAGKQPRLARNEIAAARNSDPTRAVFAASLALAQPRGELPGNGGEYYLDSQAVRQLTQHALGAVALDYSPARDQDVWKLLARVFEVLERTPDAIADLLPEPSDDPFEYDPPPSKCLREIDLAISKKLGPRGDVPEGLAADDPAAPEADDDSSLSSLALRHLESYPLLAQGLGPYRDAMRSSRTNLLGGRASLDLESKARTTERLSDSTEFQQALRDAERATSLNPLSAAAWERLGDVYRELFDFANARTAWTHALNREPDNPALYEKIGVSYWYLAYGDYAETSEADLQRAAGLFHKALLLYGNTGFREQMATHYRLGKIYVALGDFTAARGHLGIVESATRRPPVVGWLLLALAHLSRHEYADCEELFSRVIEASSDLRDGSSDEDEPLGPLSIIGDRVDERLWPLGLIQGWGSLGRALSVVERDANLAEAMADVDRAREHAKRLEEAEIADAKKTGRPHERERFPNRLAAACNDCEGLIHLKREDAEGAIAKFKDSIAEQAYSRPYLHLAWAMERQRLLDGIAWFTARQRARSIFRQRTVFERERDRIHLRRLVEHATALSPAATPLPHADDILQRIEEPSVAPTPLARGRNGN